VTFVIILLLPSLLTFITLLIHRLRAARAAQRDRAPEDIVKNLPCRVWTGKGWEKVANYCPSTSSATSTPPANANSDLELGLPAKPTPPHLPLADHGHEQEATSSDETFAQALQQPWFDTQVECAICLNDFIKGDKVRILPCFHIFHMDEVDEWLIKRKKLVGLLLRTAFLYDPERLTPVVSVQSARKMSPFNPVRSNRTRKPKQLRHLPRSNRLRSQMKPLHCCALKTHTMRTRPLPHLGDNDGSSSFQFTHLYGYIGTCTVLEPQASCIYTHQSLLYSQLDLAQATIRLLKAGNKRLNEK
jgi:hypothetical protein